MNLQRAASFSDYKHGLGSHIKTKSFRVIHIVPIRFRICKLLADHGTEKPSWERFPMAWNDELIIPKIELQDLSTQNLRHRSGDTSNGNQQHIFSSAWATRTRRMSKSAYSCKRTEQCLALNGARSAKRLPNRTCRPKARSLRNKRP